ncbi:MAG: RNA polymerase sigma factor [Planctomycetaceae bacterium]|nr:RNA polymerase sigma factor [Planctomycetaceae bacterium]
MDLHADEVPAGLPSALVARCLSGDESAWREFVRRYERPVFGLCLRMLRHRQDAEDVAQEALVRAVRNLHTWDSTRPLMPWLMTITANRCRTAIERRGRRPIATDFPIEPVEEQKTGPEDIAEEVTLALDLLRDEYRECFILFYQQGLGCAEISQVMNCPVGTIKTWLHRARNEMADHLRRRGVGGEAIVSPDITTDS